METPANPSMPDDDQALTRLRRFDDANDFLETCDRISSGYESGLYWEDVQRALRIAAGLEKWPD